MYFNSFEESFHFCQILDFSINPQYKFHKKLPNSSKGVTCGWADVTKQVTFCKYA